MVGKLCYWSNSVLPGNSFVNTFRLKRMPSRGYNPHLLLVSCALLPNCLLMALTCKRNEAGPPSDTILSLARRQKRQSPPQNPSVSASVIFNRRQARCRHQQQATQIKAVASRDYQRSPKALKHLYAANDLNLPG